MAKREFITKNQIKHEFPIMENDFGMVINERLHRQLDKLPTITEQEIVKPYLDKIRAEIEEKYGDYDICEWFEDYDYEENNISEYQQVGKVSDILSIIDKYGEGAE